MIFEETKSFFEEYKDASTFFLGFFTLLITLATLIITSFFNYKSAKAAERSADAAERAAKSSEESAKFAEQSTKSAAESTKSSADSVRIAERAAEISAKTLEVQREHNIKSLSPILHVELLNHDEEVSVNLLNKGIGPIIIKKVTVTNGVENYFNLIKWMPTHPKGVTYWQTYKGGHNELSISPGESIPSIFLGHDDENFPDYVLFRAYVRRNLSKLTMIIEAEDIYNRSLPVQTVSLNWFKAIGYKWFLDNFPADFNDDFRLMLNDSKKICSPEEWDRKVEKVERFYIPTKLNERDKPKLIIK